MADSTTKHLFTLAMMAMLLGDNSQDRARLVKVRHLPTKTVLPLKIITIYQVEEMLKHCT